MNKLEINIDSTALSTSDCIRNFYYTIVGSINPETGLSEGGYKEKLMGCSMVYGIAVHKFLDVMYKTGGHFPTAKEAAKEIFLRIPTPPPGKGKDYLKDVNHLITTCYMTWTDWVENDSTFEVLSFDGKPSTEITFKIRFYEDEFIIVYLCGTIDTIGKIKNGCYAIRDWKTTSSWDNVGYFQYYELSKQLRVYRLALTMMAEEFPDSTLGKIGATKVGAFIDAIFLKSKANDIKFGRSEVFVYSDEEMNNFRSMLTDECKRLSTHIQSNIFPKQGIIHDTCEKRFGKCKFWGVCKNNEQVGQLILKNNFNQVKFDPLNYQGEL